MTIEEVQHRHRWVMAPFIALMALLTPQRWASAAQAIAKGLHWVLVPDTTRPARFLVRVSQPLLTLRARALSRSRFLAAVDWKVRQWFWCLLWAGVIIGVRWPRRCAVPTDELPIRALSAPETYPDFAAPALVVPSGVPNAESSLLADVSVQVLQLLQDVYPIATTHQAPAPADPVERFRRAYPLLYRISRRPPVWHPDLAEASAEGNLLGLLAAGGPFAKLLQRSPNPRPGSDYLIDLSHLSTYPVREGLCRLGTVLHFGAPRGRLTVSAVEYEGELVQPGDARWEMTERIALAALVTHTTVWRQGMEYHVGGLACVPILTHDVLPPDHPLRRLLAPHMSQSMLTNYATHLTLRRSGFDVLGFSFPIDTLMRYYNDGAAAFDILRLDIAADARARGIGDRLDYPYLPQALRYWATFETYVRAYVEHTYPSEESLAGDRQAHLWFEALDRYMVRGVRRYAAMLDKENLIKLCTLLIYGQALGHTENSLFNYACFLPTSVHRDGTQQTVGEVQCTVNFQYLITARTTLMMDDFSHLALDDGARRVMRDFRRSLMDLQAEMAAEEPRYWHLFPTDLEAAVSA